ncbi:MAG: hypothetical protein IJE46_03405 [Clostridia bacterium]|nr:hypothetical protein [Clostridia bacterium]
MNKYLLTFFIALLHEAGHLLVARNFGYKINGIKIEPFGVCLKLSDKKICSFHEVLISAAGPCVNILLVIFGAIAVKFGIQISNVFFISNFYMLFINLLPVMPLDGGRILKAVLFSEFESKFSKRIVKIISLIFTSVIFICGIIFFVRSKQNISLFVAALFLLDNIRFRDSKSSKITNLYFSDIDKDLTKVYYLGENVLVKDALKFLPYDSINVVFIIDSEGTVIATVTNKYILKLVSNGYSNDKLSNAINLDLN